MSKERRRCADLRDRFSASRRHVAEKYYDCLQCTEQCRHVIDKNNPPNNSGISYNNNNDNGTVAIARIRSNHRLPVSNLALYPDVPTSPPDEIRKIRNTRDNLARAKSLTKHQSTHLTPVKKRSSLARPVRVHDSFVQLRRPMAEEDPCHDSQRDQQTRSCKNPWWWQERCERQEPNASTSYAYHRSGNVEDGSAGWPIRLRLEQMLELTLPQTKRKKKKKKKKKTTTATATMLLMKQQQRGRHGFKDTERLLKVLSINNVDQDNRYNVKRCSVM
ncbi:uncharacterized protein LOC126852661 [Cataglyphis hispanica]|uniref:uncharacterized protein LOC126852661 n=1 Tax=Cataglyphis hispanica TaxID=1086592 RepID=UPI00217F9C3F|nr:uncharacterized protein LOC126852661 [Cataglyphis hispanica]